jgi:hypothetical protein
MTDGAPARRYFHTTDAADAILAGGFRDGTGNYGIVDVTLTGVFLADSPVDVNDGSGRLRSASHGRAG